MIRILYTPREEFTVGRMDSCSVVFSNKAELSKVHIKIMPDNDRIICHMLGKNGGLINGRFIRYLDKVTLEYADQIDIVGVKILWLGRLIAIKCDEDLITSLDEYLSEDKQLYPLCEMISANPPFSKTPRIFYSVNEETIELDPPPEKTAIETQSTLATVGPALTMGLPMIMGVMVTRFASKNSINSAGFMYTGLVTAVCSALLGVIWAVTNLKNRKKQYIQGEINRKNKYIKYVEESEKMIRERYNINTGNLRLMYPSVQEYFDGGINKLILWNRSVDDMDFLHVRIGVGNKRLKLNINIPKDRFSITEDELKTLPKQLKNKYQILKSVPKTLDLNDNKYCGVVSSEKANLEQIFLQLIFSIAVSISPMDISIGICLRDGIISADIIRQIRFLPHLNSGAKNRIVFTDNTNFIGQATESANSRVITFSKYFEQLPSECTLIIQNERQFSGILTLYNNSSKRSSVYFDRIELKEAEVYARRLQSIKLEAENENYIIPAKVAFYELFGKEIISEDVLEFWKINNTENAINIPIGISENGEILELDFHEKSMGPHGLVAGMTGSGKSEVLQTIILALSIKFSPSEIGFFLIDYKGGGMSEQFKSLPHLMGSISNLSGRMIRRAMASIKSENERRQRLFNECRVNNIYEYLSLYRKGIVVDSLPHIFIIIDEFAELKREEPDFMKEIISVARIGRSLGIHLILSTQKPSGTVDDNILSNLRFRICLRLQDKMDSIEVLHKPDASNLTGAGRAYIQVGNDEIYKMFQGAYTMDKANTVIKKWPLTITDELGREVRKKEIIVNDEDREPQLKRAISEIETAAKEISYQRGRPLWLEPLSENIFVDDFIFDGKEFSIPIGVYDDPAHQKQDKLFTDIVNTGHHIILGSLQSGKSTLLSTISFALCAKSVSQNLNIYLVDFSHGRLKPFSKAVSCGGYICEENEEDMEKLIILILKIINERKELFKGGNFSQFIKKDSDSIPPAIFLIVDGLGMLRERTMGRYDKEFETILKNGEALGIYVIASALNISAAEVPRRMYEHFRVSIPLQLRDVFEYKEALSAQTHSIFMPESKRGRGLINMGDDICEFQAFQAIQAENDFERVEKLSEEVLSINHTITKLNLKKYMGNVRKIPCIPRNLSYKSFLEEINSRGISNEEADNSLRNLLPVGFYTRSGEVFYIPLIENLTILIAGRLGSGKKNLLSIIAKMSGRHSDGRRVEFENGMKVCIYDENLSLEEECKLKKEAGSDPYVIYMGGNMDRQNIADFSYIPYSEQIKMKPPGHGHVRKTAGEHEWGDVIIPYDLF